MSFAAGLLANCVAVKPNPPTTIIAPPIVEAQPSFDGEEQNSGIVDYIDGKGFLITADAAARYTELTKRFGAQLIPPLSEGQGLEKQVDGHFILPASFMVEFAMMSDKSKKTP